MFCFFFFPQVYVADHTLEQVLRDPEDMTCCEVCTHALIWRWRTVSTVLFGLHM